jgi:hypothetical protein
MPDAELNPQQQADLEAIQFLRQELRTWLSSEDAESLEAELGIVLGSFETPDERPRIITGEEVGRAWEFIARYPQALQRLEVLRAESPEWKYQGPPGLPVEVPPGPVLVCPKDPSHYQRYVLKTGERLRCPQHDVDLVPPDQAGS